MTGLVSSSTDSGGSRRERRGARSGSTAQSVRAPGPTTGRKSFGPARQPGATPLTKTDDAVLSAVLAGEADAGPSALSLPPFARDCPLMATRYDPSARRQTAMEMMTALDGEHDELRRLAVRCRRSHEVADVYAIAGELVYVARPRGRGHGRRDRPDIAHHGHEHGVVFADLLDVSAGGDPDDELPASCECGSHLLQRAMLLDAVAHDVRLIMLD